MADVKNFSLELAGRTLSVEVGKLATLSSGACTVRYGDTVVLATAIMSKDVRPGGDYFPLMVEVRENMYAAGKIKGSRFIKREGRPTDNATLCARMVDRGIRPLFNQDLKHEVQVVVTALSYDDENAFDVISIIASSIAVHISDIPWNGPLAGISVGRINNEFVINPTNSQLEQSDLKLVFSIVDDKVIMVDAEGDEISEEVMAQAFEYGIKESQTLLQFINSIREAVGKPKQDEQKLLEMALATGEIALDRKKEVFEKFKTACAPLFDQYLFNQPKGTKRERKVVAKAMLEQALETLSEEERHPEIVGYIKGQWETYLETVVTKAILDREQRIDGRSLTAIRPLVSEVAILPRTHGSAIFSRGETQVLSIVTLGAPGDAQLLDEMTEDETKKGYIHYYNSPPYAFGEVGFFRGAGRREIGHGALAEKALMPVLPDKMTFPYTIMVVSEVMGSNGSSSMASTCGSTLSLLDAGVPIKRPVAGIAMGLASDESRFKVLTDLQDFEDGPGGMDFKVAGTVEGITAIQMDTKTMGVSLEICRQTLVQAKAARVEILQNMAATIPTHRADLSPFAPRIVSFKIDPDKIRDVIGSGGKIINEIIAACEVAIDIEDDGTVAITGVNPDGVKRAVKWVEDLTKEIMPGEVYDGTVVRLMDFGAFVQILPGRDGMVHISEFSNERIDKITDVAILGQALKVKVIEIDDKGRINLSVKKADPHYSPANDGRPQGGNDSRPPRRPFTRPPFKR
jgi:polyribonucleotide nucleotidyltransferase